MDDKALIDYWASLCEDRDATIDKHLDETPDEVFSRLGMLSEMAIPLSEYQAKAEDLRFQIVENWCLCKHCQLYNPTCTNFRHWKIELSAFIKKLKFIEIKNRVSKKKTLTRAWVSRCDLDKPGMVLDIIKDKFEAEGIVDKIQIEAVATLFANNIEGLINCISDRNVTPDNYIHSTFGTNDTFGTNIMKGTTINGNIRHQS